MVVRLNVCFLCVGGLGVDDVYVCVSVVICVLGSDVNIYNVVCCIYIIFACIHYYIFIYIYFYQLHTAKMFAVFGCWMCCGSGSCCFLLVC